jgi:hypothetical protein
MPLTMAVHTSWPTPTAGDAKSSDSRNTPGSKAHAGISLTDKVRGDGGTGQQEPSLENFMQSLATATNSATVPTPNANDWKGSSKPGQRRGQLTDPDMDVIPAGGKLNPTWVEWLMGFPLGWTACAASGMPSSQRAPTSSAPASAS